MTKIYVAPDKSQRECEFGWFDTWDKLINRVLAVVGRPVMKLEEGEVAVDIHLHTMFSHCSISEAEKVILRAVSLGFGGIGVLDHNNIRGAQDAMDCADDLKQKGLIPQDFVVIPGIEINTTIGHVGALFLNENIPGINTPEKTVDLIHEAGGLAVATHPYLSTGIGDAIFNAPFDAVEVFCGAAFSKISYQKNMALIDDPRLENVAKLGSSDAHYINAIGYCGTIFKIQKMSLESVRNAIENKNTRGYCTNPYHRMRKILGGIGKLK